MTDPAEPDDAPDTSVVSEQDALREQCTRFLIGHGRRTPARLLEEVSSLGDDLLADTYGAGGTVTMLESAVRTLLDKPAAVFLPSGTMAQQLALRIHADRRGRRVVAFHPTCHLELHEDKAYQRLHGLVGRPIGSAEQLITLDDVTGVAEPLAAVVLELPQREIGGLLPTWDELTAVVDAVRERGAAVHLDGARLWECTTFYERSLAEIASLFDTVYVSFYKGLGGLAGCCLLGAEDVCAEVREWRARHGGTLYAMWPYAAAGLAGLRHRLPLMADYVAKARAIAVALADVDGVVVRPDPPQTPMMHLHLRTDVDTYRATHARLATEDKLWVWPDTAPSALPGWRRVELAVGDATLDWAPERVRDVIAGLVR